MWLFVTILFKTCDKEQEENLEQDQVQGSDGWMEEEEKEKDNGGVIFGASGIYSRRIATRRTLWVK